MMTVELSFDREEVDVVFTNPLTDEQELGVVSGLTDQNSAAVTTEEGTTFYLDPAAVYNAQTGNSLADFIDEALAWGFSLDDLLEDADEDD